MHAAELMVQPVDSAANIDITDVIGSKDDTHDGNSLMARAHIVEEHIHNAGKVYPSLAGGVAVATGGAPWALTAGFVQIVPVTTIRSDFDIHYISIEALDDNTVYEIILFAVSSELGRVRVVKNAQQDGTMNIPFQCAIIPADTQIQAKCASAAGNSVATISIFYHLY